MAGLPPGTEEVLTVAALLGREAATDILTRVAGLPEERVLDIVDAAVGARLLVEGDGPSCRFVHDIVRDVLREALPPLRRRRLHARIAEVLEERSGTRLTEIAHHYREGLLNPGWRARPSVTPGARRPRRPRSSPTRTRWRTWRGRSR